MPLGHWNVEWLNQNSQRAYPLTTAATKRDKTGTIEIPNDFIVALRFPVHAGLAVEPHRFFLRALNISPTGVIVELGYDDGSASPPLVGVTHVATSTHTENRAYVVVGVDDFSDSIGRIVIGTLDRLRKLPPGQYDFTPTAGAIETDAIDPMLRGISALVVVSASGDRSERLYGDIALIAGDNMRITATTTPGQSPQVVFDAIAGEGLNETCICDPAETEAPYIRTINGLPPLPDGNFRLNEGDCVQISPIANGLRLDNTCSQPCCGCDELKALEGQIDRFADGVVTLQNFVTNLGAEQSQFNAVVLGSKLNDQGCIAE